MAHYVFLGANSAVARAALAQLDPNDHVLALSRSALDQDMTPNCQIESHLVDPFDHDAVSQAIAAYQVDHPIDGAVNFCGSICLKPIHLLSQAEWDQTLKIHLQSAFVLAKAIVTHTPSCHLVFFSTAAASIGLPNHEAVACAKAGIEGLAKSIAASYASRPIRCNVIAPGLVESAMSAPIFNQERAVALSKHYHPMGQLGQPEDIARFLVWLIHPHNRWITGEVFHIDGGLSTVKSPPRAA